MKQNQNNTEYSGLEEILNTEVMINYNSFIVELAMKYSTNTKDVIDFGAGIGTLSTIIRDSYQVEPMCVEIDEVSKKYLLERGFKIYDELSACNSEVDLIFSSNVLEHIEDDISILSDMGRYLKPNGKIFLYLPAKMLLWSRLDEEVGHYRRYELNELKHKCKQAGLKVDVIHFADSIGFFASIAMKIFGYNKDAGIGSVSSLKFYDKWLLPISIMLDKLGFKYLFGKNIVLVASK
jgi:SAM-dependent methyltransferase